MSAISHHNHFWRFWFVSFLCALISIYLLRDILLPFVAGIVVAYFLDPLCDRLENVGLSRTFATVIVTVFFLSVFLLGLAFILPVFFSTNTKNFINILPNFIDLIYQKIDRLRENFSGGFDPDSLIGLKSSLNTGLSSAGRWVTGVMGNVVKGGLALLNLLSLIFITPVVTFYLLRDWDRIVARVDGWLPQAHRVTIRGLAREVDDTLAGFIRGQGTVCLILGGFYALGLTLAGLNFGGGGGGGGLLLVLSPGFSPLFPMSGP